MGRAHPGASPNYVRSRDVSSLEPMPESKRAARGACGVALLCMLAAEPGCTIAGTFAGIGMNVSEPGPYEELPLPPRAQLGVQSFEQLELSAPDKVELVLLDGTHLEGKYVGLEAPTASDPEMYIVLVLKRENGRLPSRRLRKGQRHVPLSEVRTIGVEVNDYRWILGGFAVGLAIDVFLIYQVMNANFWEDLSS
jgi:hypothetical protein